MPRWTFEPGHTAAEFQVRHMMVCWVRGHFKDVHGTLDFDQDDPCAGTADVRIDAAKLWTGEKDRAFKRLDEAAKLPGYLSYGQLRLHPIWEPLRGDPRFEKIVASLAPK